MEKGITDGHVGCVAIVPSQRISNNLRPIGRTIVIVMVVVYVIDVTVGVIVPVVSAQRVEGIILGHRQVVSVEGIPVAEIRKFS